MTFANMIAWLDEWDNMIYGDPWEARQWFADHLSWPRCARGDPPDRASVDDREARLHHLPMDPRFATAAGLPVSGFIRLIAREAGILI